MLSKDIKHILGTQDVDSTAVPAGITSKKRILSSTRIKIFNIPETMFKIYGGEFGKQGNSFPLERTNCIKTVLKYWTKFFANSTRSRNIHELREDNG